MDPYQERVLAERVELKQKFDRLTTFLAVGSVTVDATDRLLLERQQQAMLDYLLVLSARIERWQER